MTKTCDCGGELVLLRGYVKNLEQDLEDSEDEAVTLVERALSAEISASSAERKMRALESKLADLADAKVKADELIAQLRVGRDEVLAALKRHDEASCAGAG